MLIKSIHIKFKDFLLNEASLLDHLNCPLGVLFLLIKFKSSGTRTPTIINLPLN